MINSKKGLINKFGKESYCFMTKQRIGYLDIAKGIGILLMIFGHIDGGGVVQTWIYSFHIPLFFIVSGIIVFKQNKKILI